MTIPVVWLTLNDDAIARGYWDQAMLEALLDGSLWQPPGSPEFAHHEVHGPEGWVPVVGAAEGAVVIVAARHHADPKTAHLLNELLRALPWCLLILTGDEAAEFPWETLSHPRMRVWAMGARAENHEGVDVPLGSGWPPGIRDVLATIPADHRRAVPWAFMGQVTHRQREECVRSLGESARAVLLETDGFTKGAPQGDYWRVLAGAKLAPCPSGPESPDSFRLYEALEAGCVPLADAATPHGPDPGHWTYIMGESPPFPEVHAWESAPEIILQSLSEWPANANRCFAWWQGWKRRLAYRLADDLAALSGVAPEASRPDDEITVVITTSPTPLHPSTDDIVATIDSVREQLPRAEIIVAIDGVRPEARARRDVYGEYVRRLLWLTNLRWSNVLPLLLPEWGHQANATRAALAEVRTPLVLFMEHDTPLEGPPIPWAAAAHAVRSGQANVIRLYHEAEIHPSHRHLMLDDEPRWCADGRLPLVRTVQWSQRPHLSHAMFYRALLEQYFAEESRTMIEDVMHGVVQDAWGRYGEAGWERWRVWLYAPPGPIKRSTHLDSRGGDPKHEMRFAYPGSRPEGAPPPTRSGG